MEYKDYYKIMGVKRDATQDELKRAYRKLARKYHPDVSKEKDAEEHFKEVGEAYEVLKDPEKRAAYDQLGSGWQSGQDFRPPPDWNQSGPSGSAGFSGNAEQFSDFFESLFGRGGFSGGFNARRSQGFSARGEDSHARVVIDLNDAYQGATRALTLRQTTLGEDGHPQVQERTLNVRIPRGVTSGQLIRLARQGNPGIGGGEPGDLFLEVEFRPHPFYHVEGRDVFLDLPVAPWEAALGASVTVPTPSGNVELKIPPNSAAGRKLRFKGRGIPAREPGDFYVVLQVVLPEAKDEAAKAAYQEFAKAFPFNPRAGLGV